MMSERAKLPDCGSLLPLVVGSPAAGRVSACCKADPLPRGRSCDASIDVQRPSRQQGWLRRAAAGCRSPGVMLLALMFIAMNAVAAPVDVLTNGSLEPPYSAVSVSNANGTVTGMRPAGWQDNSTFTGSHTDTVYAEETSATISGSALKVTAAVQSGQTSGAAFQMYQVVPAVAGRSYSATIWLKASQNGTVTFRLRQSASPFTVRATMNCAVTTAWQSFTLNLSAPANEFLRLDVAMNNQPITLWIDEVSLSVADGNREWYVSPGGLDTNDGSLAAPFQTLARAMQSVVAGDTLWLRAGTYRETLTVNRSGTPTNRITISAYPGETVKIDGCDVVPGPWTPTTNGIHTADVPVDLGNGYNQVFVDGVMQHQARHPNHGSTDLLSPSLASVTVTNASAATNPNTISSTSFGGQPANFFAGARFCGGVGQKWSWQTAVVTASSGNLLTVDPATKSVWWWPDYVSTTNTSDTGTGFVFGLLGLLDADGEWHVQTNASAPHTLHLRITSGADPSTHLVEMKRRNWCVDVNGFNHVTVRGIDTRAGAIRLNGTGNALEDADAAHLSHYMLWTNGSSGNGGRAEGGGIILSGTGNTVRGCTIHDTAGCGVLTSGSGHLITRNEIFNIDYTGTYASPVSMDGDHDVLTFNSIHDTGRDGVRPTGSGQTLMFNDISKAGRLAHDTACIYTYAAEGAAANGKRTRIAYNWAHDRGDPGDSLSKAIYLDNGCRNFDVDHNVTWNCSDAAMRLNSPAFGHQLHHNTIIGTGSYNDNTWSNYETTSPTYGGLTFTDLTHGLDFIARNNMNVPAASTGAAFENYAARDFRPKAAYSFTDKRSGTTAAVNPAASANSVEWVKAAGNTSLANPYITLAMRVPALSFFYRESFGQGQSAAGVNAWVPDGKPDSGAYERGVVAWQPGVNGWEAIKADVPAGIGARTAVLQGVRVSMDTTSATTVRVYYGTADGGTNAAAWENVAEMGTAAPGDVISVFRHPIAGLNPGTTYHVRYFASHAGGSSWSDGQSFTTAASLTWDAGAGASTGISTSTNWLGDATPDLTSGGEIAIFGSAGSTAVVDAFTSLRGLVFNRDAAFSINDGPGSLTLGADGITMTLPTTTARTHTISESHLVLAADQTWSITSNTGAAVLNVASSISGPFGITKAGTGSLTLSGASSYSGDTNVNVGVLAISSGTALGHAAGITSIAATGSSSTGGQLRLSGDIALDENITITGTTETGSFLRAIDNISGTNTLNGSITLVGTGQVRLGPAAGTLQFNGSITRSGSDVGPLMLAPATGSMVIIAQPIDTNGSTFNVTGGGTVLLNASSTDLGGTTIFFGASSPNGPVVKLGVNDALPTNRNVTLGTNSTSNGADKGTLDLAGFNQTINALIGTQGTGTTPSAASTRRITNSAATTTSTLTVGNGNASGTFNGLIEDGAGKVALTKVGTGTLTLPTANTYTGDTTVSGGTLSLATASLAATSAVNLSTGSVLNLNFTGTNHITTLLLNGLAQAPGTWGSLTSSATNKTSLITGPGLLNITAPQPAYDAWALASGLDGTPGKDAAITADTDGDGVANLLEYATKMNPSANDVVPQAATKNGANLEFVYTRNKSATDVTFVVEWSDTLGNDWSTVGVTQSLVAGSDNGVTQQWKAMMPAGSSRRFTRLKVTRP